MGGVGVAVAPQHLELVPVALQPLEHAPRVGPVPHQRASHPRCMWRAQCRDWQVGGYGVPAVVHYTTANPPCIAETMAASQALSPSLPAPDGDGCPCSAPTSFLYCRVLRWPLTAVHRGSTRVYSLLLPALWRCKAPPALLLAQSSSSHISSPGTHTPRTSAWPAQTRPHPQQGRPGRRRQTWQPCVSSCTGGSGWVAHTIH